MEKGDMNTKNDAMCKRCSRDERGRDCTGNSPCVPDYRKAGNDRVFNVILSSLAFKL